MLNRSVNQMAIKRLPSVAAAGGTVLLLHGWGFDQRCWQSLVPFFQARHQVLLVDLPGFGDSEPLPVDSAELWLDQTLILLEKIIQDAAEQTGPVYIVGWSLGGQLALRLLQRNSRVDRAVAIASNLQFCANDFWPAAMAQTTYVDFLRNFSIDPKATLTSFLRLVSAGEVDSRSLRKTMPSLLAVFDESVQANWQFALQALQLLDHTAATFNRPALLLLSDNDALVPVSVAQAAGSIEGLSSLCLSQASHGHLLIAPERVAKAILSFLDV